MARYRSDDPPNLFLTGLAGAVAMACAMGFGRFAFTPILPAMMAGLPLSAADAGLIAAANFAGYLLGALLSAHGWFGGRERRAALLSLLATVLLLAAMGLSGSLPAFLVARFLAGFASAFVLVFSTAIVLGHGARADNAQVPAVHFGGVGAGIALSSLLVMAIGLLPLGSDGWRVDWLAAAGVGCVGLVVVWRLLPAAPRRPRQAADEPRPAWTAPLLLVTAAYGLFGFGYVITATFLVTIARMGEAGAMVEFLAWFVTGIAAAVSLAAWTPAQRRLGLAGAFVAALLIQAAGVVATVLLPPALAPLIGGLLFGATFMIVTAYGLQIGRRLAPHSPRKALSAMTVAFSIGQIAGPLAAGWIAAHTGSFAAPTLLAAAVLVLCALLVLPVARRI